VCGTSKQSKVVVFGGGRLNSGVQFTYKELKLVLMDNFRYLGVIFSRFCSFDLCVDTLCILNRAHLNFRWSG